MRLRHDLHRPTYQRRKVNSPLFSDCCADLHLNATTQDLPHIHMIHTAKDDQRYRSRAAVLKTQGQVCEEALSASPHGWQPESCERGKSVGILRILVLPERKWKDLY